MVLLLLLLSRPVMKYLVSFHNDKELVLWTLTHSPFKVSARPPLLDMINGLELLSSSGGTVTVVSIAPAG